MTQPSLPFERLDGAAPEPLRTGYYVLPRGKLANFCVYLEMPAPTVPPVSPAPPAGMRLERLEARDAERYRRLFRAIGERWLWAGHLRLTEAEIATLLERADMETWAVVGANGDVGLLQLEFDSERGAELLYFGVVPDAIGQGLGRWLIRIGMARAFARPGVRRFWLHTCNFDHPRAIAFYQSAGFRIYATGFEVMDDPRIAGRLPVSAAPHVPLVPE